MEKMMTVKTIKEQFEQKRVSVLDEFLPSMCDRCIHSSTISHKNYGEIPDTDEITYKRIYCKSTFQVSYEARKISIASKDLLSQHLPDDAVEKKVVMLTIPFNSCSGFQEKVNSFEEVSEKLAQERFEKTRDLTEQFLEDETIKIEPSQTLQNRI